MGHGFLAAGVDEQFPARSEGGDVQHPARTINAFLNARDPCVAAHHVGAPHTVGFGPPFKPLRFHGESVAPRSSVPPDAQGRGVGSVLTRRASASYRGSAPRSIGVDHPLLSAFDYGPATTAANPRKPRTGCKCSP